jgi:hypothetical protein
MTCVASGMTLSSVEAGIAAVVGEGRTSVDMTTTASGDFSMERMISVGIICTGIAETVVDMATLNCDCEG